MRVSNIEAAALSVPVLIKLAKKEQATSWHLRTDQAEMLAWESQLGLKMKDVLLTMVMFNRGVEVVNGEESRLTPEQFVELASRGDWRNAQETALAVALAMMAIDDETLIEVIEAAEDQSGSLVSEVLTNLGVNLDKAGTESVRHGLVGMIEHKYDRILESLEGKKGI